jgi:signal transduction histidine kinase
MPNRPPDAPSLNPDEMALDAIQFERSVIGETIHRTLCQSLSGVALMVSMMADRAKKGHPIDAEELNTLALAIRISLAEAKQICLRFGEMGEEASSLMDALRGTAKELSATIPCSFQCEEPVFVSNRRKAALLFRIADTAISQALHQANASRLAIVLQEAGGKIVLTVKYESPTGEAMAMGNAARAFELLQYQLSIVGGRMEIVAMSPSARRWVCTVPV